MRSVGVEWCLTMVLGLYYHNVKEELTGHVVIRREVTDFNLVEETRVVEAVGRWTHVCTEGRVTRPCR